MTTSHTLMEVRSRVVGGVEFAGCDEGDLAGLLVQDPRMVRVVSEAFLA